tara:strand:- start:961 stop:1242 length:282 start_codon:yes stop_codon:yes gene_type:complete
MYIGLGYPIRPLVFELAESLDKRRSEWEIYYSGGAVHVKSNFCVTADQYYIKCGIADMYINVREKRILGAALERAIMAAALDRFRTVALEMKS